MLLEHAVRTCGFTEESILQDFLENLEHQLQYFPKHKRFFISGSHELNQLYSKAGPACDGRFKYVDN